MPYGLGHASWDTAVWNEEKIAAFLREVTVCANNLPGLPVVIWAPWDQLVTVREAMRKSGFSDIEHFTWVKPVQNMVGNAHSLVPAVEQAS